MLARQESGPENGNRNTVQEPNRNAKLAKAAASIIRAACSGLVKEAANAYLKQRESIMDGNNQPLNVPTVPPDISENSQPHEVAVVSSPESAESNQSSEVSTKRSFWGMLGEILSGDLKQEYRVIAHLSQHPSKVISPALRSAAAAALHEAANKIAPNNNHRRS